MKNAHSFRLGFSFSFRFIVLFARIKYRSFALFCFSLSLSLVVIATRSLCVLFIHFCSINGRKRYCCCWFFVWVFYNHDSTHLYLYLNDVEWVCLYVRSPQFRDAFAWMPDSIIPHRWTARCMENNNGEIFWICEWKLAFLCLIFRHLTLLSLSLHITIAISSQWRKKEEAKIIHFIYSLSFASDMGTPLQMGTYTLLLYIIFFFLLLLLLFSRLLSVCLVDGVCVRECLLAQIYGYKYFSNEMRKLYVVKANVCQTICFRSMFFGALLSVFI